MIDSQRFRAPTLVGVFLLVCFAAAHLGAQAGAQGEGASATPSARVVRLHGLVEPIRSYTVSAPRLTGATTPGGPPGQLIVVRLARGGTFVKAGDLLVEFDRHTQLKAARDREAEF